MSYMQTNIRNFFSTKSPPTQAESARTAAKNEGGQVAKHAFGTAAMTTIRHTFVRKRKRVEDKSSQKQVGAQPKNDQDAPPQLELGPPQFKQHDKKKERTGQLTQMFMDVGQKDFHLSKCSVCGLVYAKGEQADERLHAAYHTNSTKGVRYQPWGVEKVLSLEANRGKIVAIPCADSRPKKLRELCRFLEDQMGLVKGWLLSAPVCLYLYVSGAKRVLGCVVAEAVREACPVVPQLDPPEVEQLRSHCSAVHGGVSSWQGPSSQQRAAATLSSCPAASITFSSCTEGTGVAEPALQGAQNAGPQPQKPPPGTAAAAAAERRGDGGGGDERTADSSPGPSGVLGEPAVDQSCHHRHHEQQQQPRHYLQGQHAQGGASFEGEPQATGRHGCPCEQTAEQDRGPLQYGGGAGLQVMDPGSADDPQACLGSDKRLPGRDERQPGVRLGRTSPAAAAGGADAVQRGAPQVGSSRSGDAVGVEAQQSGRRVLVVDRTKPVRCVCGVRLVWVSVEARRRGVATRLLDCMRSHFVMGYVVPRHQLAYTQPSDQGRALIEAYASTRKFLVY